MRLSLIPFIGCALWLAGCAGQPAKPVEVLDERTGLTVVALKEAIELVQDAQTAGVISGRHATFAYIGPVEWNRSGTISYGLWVHIAPGNDRPAGDIHAAGALNLMLDDGPLALSPIEAPKLGRDPYRDAVSWGQTAYFDLNDAALRRMAESRKLELEVRAMDGTLTRFTPTSDNRSALSQYIQSRGITRD